MKKQILFAVIFAISGALFSGTVLAEDKEGWVVLPYQNDDFDPHFTVALATGIMDPNVTGASSGAINGLVLSLNCPWFQPPTGTIRQVFNYNIYDEDNLEIKTFEMNPRYFIPISPSVQVGFGPGVGYVTIAPKDNAEAHVLSFQVGADLDYRNKNLFAGLSARYMMTQEAKFGGMSENDVDNLAIQLRVGYNF